MNVETEFLDGGPLGDAALWRALYRFVQSRVGDRHTAEDLTQEILLRATRKRNALREREKMGSWLFGIARNVVADYFRQARPTLVFDERMFPDHNTEEPLVSRRDEEILRKHLNQYVRSVVENLPPLYREALILTEYEGITQVELSRRAGISVSAAKSRVQRARARVRKTIESCCDVKTDIYGTLVDCRPRKEPVSQRLS